MIHLYALCSPAAVPAAAAGVRGLGDVVVRGETAGDLVAVVSDHAHPPEPTTGNALRHAEVVATVSDRGPSLPVRFGSHHRDLETLRSLVETRRTELTHALARIGDAVEVVVRVGRPVAPAAVTTGHDARTYLAQRLAEQEARQAREAAAGQALATATSMLAEQALAVRDRHARAGPERSFLIPRAHAETFVAEARRVAETLTGAVVGGPWPPYTFADVEVGV